MCLHVGKFSEQMFSGWMRFPLSSVVLGFAKECKGKIWDFNLKLMQCSKIWRCESLITSNLTILKRFITALYYQVIGLWIYYCQANLLETYKINVRTKSTSWHDSNEEHAVVASSPNPLRSYAIFSCILISKNLGIFVLNDPTSNRGNLIMKSKVYTIVLMEKLKEMINV
jgi:hypothetical protein